VARDGRGRAAQPGRPNQQWGVDFVSDALAWGRRIRLFTVVDVFTREALAIEVDTALPGGRVVRVLERLAAERGAPDEIVLDNGPELAGKALDRWAYERGVGLRFIEPGRPSRTPSSRASRGGLRDECLDRHWFLGLADARQTVEAWRQRRHRRGPHSALGLSGRRRSSGSGFDAAPIRPQELAGLS
jgi:putative transposase